MWTSPLTAAHCTRCGALAVHASRLSGADEDEIDRLIIVANEFWVCTHVGWSATPSPITCATDWSSMP
jgi:hypothetical protein